MKKKKNKAPSTLDAAAAHQKAMLDAANRKAIAAKKAATLIRFKPLKSNALKVHPKTIQKYMEIDKRRGVQVDYTADGRPQFTSSKQFRDYCKGYGMRHYGY